MKPMNSNKNKLNDKKKKNFSQNAKRQPNKMIPFMVDVKKIYIMAFILSRYFYKISSI